MIDFSKPNTIDITPEPENYKMDKRGRINDPKEFPQDFWNYLVNPILGYYVKPAHLGTRGKLKDNG